MTMTGNQFDALLRAAGDELDARSAAHVAVERAAEDASRRHIAGFATVGLVAAGIAALVVVANVRDGNDSPAIIPADTSAPASTELDPATFAGVQVCADALAEYSVPEQIGEFPLPDPATAEIRLLDIPGQPTRVRVLMVGNGAIYTCAVERGIDADDRIVSDSLSLAPTDEPSDVEECAAEPLCVETRMLELQQLAADWPEQAAILADGVVTEQEHAVANQRFVACLVEAGIDAEVMGRGDVITDGPAEEDRTAVIGCGVAHLDLVDQLFRLHDAQRRLADG